MVSREKLTIQGSGTLMQGEPWMLLGRVAVLSLLMVGGLMATPCASQQDAAVMALRLRAIQQIPSPIQLSNGERIHGLDHMKVYTCGKKFLPTFPNRSMSVKSMAKVNHSPKYGECLSL